MKGFVSFVFSFFVVAGYGHSLRTSRALNGTAWIETIRKQHNQYRADHRAVPVKLQSELQRLAQTWADTLQQTGIFQHGLLTDSQQRRIGQNIAWSSSQQPTLNVSKLVEWWYNEVRFYNFSNPIFTPQAGHFTQLVWNASTTIGVGISQGPKGTYVVVDYFPAGNVGGQFTKNVFPKRIGAS